MSFTVSSSLSISSKKPLDCEKVAEFLGKAGIITDVTSNVSIQRDGKEYGFRLPITKQQIKAFIKGMETPRSLRMMDRMAPEMRAYFQQEMTRNPERVGTTAEALTNIPTTADRRRAFGTDTPVELSPEILAEIKRSIAETDQQRAALTEGGFEAFGGF